MEEIKFSSIIDIVTMEQTECGATLKTSKALPKSLSVLGTGFKVFALCKNSIEGFSWVANYFIT